MKKFDFPKLFAAIIALATVTGVTAQDGNVAEPCYGDTIYSFDQGQKTNGTAIGADRSNAEIALGMPSMNNAAGSFVSLGVGGSIVIGFDGVALNGTGHDLEIYETSFSGDNCDQGDDEFADIYLTADPFIDGFEVTWISAGQICRDAQIDFEDYSLDFITAVKIVNADITQTPDGYDVDGIRAINGCGSFPVIEEGCFGYSALLYEPGTGTIPAERANPEHALEAPERDDTINFVALGFGGTLIIGFEESAIAVEGADDLELVETTFGAQTCTSYEERAHVYVSQDVVEDPTDAENAYFVYVGESCTNGEFFDIYAATADEEGGPWTYFTMVKIVDSTPQAAQLAGRDGYDVDGIVALHGCAPVPDPVIEDEPCEGTWRTQSQGGWGQPGNGNNAGAYRDANFDDAFPNGVVVGCEDGFTLTLTSASAVQSFLPSGGQPSALSASLTDPSSQSNGNGNGNGNGGGGNSNFGTFAGNITALALSLGFDENDDDFSDSSFPLSGLTIQDGSFSGYTVAEIFAIANEVFGGCSTEYTPQELNEILDDINNSYVDGEEQGSNILGCGLADALPMLPPVYEQSTQAVLGSFPNPSKGQVNITFTPAGEELVTIEVLDMSGRTINTLFRQVANAGQNYRIEFDGSSLPNGVYITKMTTSSEVLIQKVMIAR